MFIFSYLYLAGWIQWMSFYSSLKKYIKKFGNCNALEKWPETPKLYAWVQDQRFRRNNNSLGEKRINQLNEIGFDWKLTYRKGVQSRSK